MTDRDAPSAFIPFPQVVETTHRGERSWDIYSRLLKDRIVFLGTDVNDDVANIIIAQMLLLGERRSGQGHHALHQQPQVAWCTAGLAIFDTMQYVRSPVATVCLGQAASMAAWILAAGTKGRRKALPNARVMIHQPLGGTRGQATDIEIQAKEILFIREKMNVIMEKHTGKPASQIKLDTDRDRWSHRARGQGVRHHRRRHPPP
jgi:ATP-dependent Clp protease protease subunit